MGKRAFKMLFMGVCVGGGMGLNAPAHPSAMILWYCVARDLLRYLSAGNTLSNEIFFSMGISSFPSLDTSFRGTIQFAIVSEVTLERI